jgi:gamma-glutamyltranspeptidase/glutathione hydrolase
MGVSLINSNASGFGSGLVEQRTGINLHNRGLGFSLMRGHESELAAGRQPPHTLCPALITRKDNSLLSVLGTMGGDAQPQIILQLITRLLRSSGAARTPAEIVCHQQYKSKGTHQKVGYANSPHEDTKLSNALDSTQALVTQT